MEIYYLKKEEFLNSIDISSLKKFSDNREFSSEEKYLEHLCGLFLTKFIAKQIYNIKNTEIELKNKKPYFKNNEIYFSVSHSKNIVLVGFNNANIGVDTEYMYPRNYQKIMDRYNKNIVNPTKKDFYRFWTIHEAEIKLGKPPKAMFSTNLENDYALSCVCDDVLVSNLKIKKLKIKSQNINLIKELQTPQNIQLEMI